MNRSPKLTTQRAKLLTMVPVRHKMGLTLLELVIVLLVLVVLSGLLVPIVAHHGDRSRTQTTEASLANLRDMVTQYWQDMDKELPRSPTSAPQTLYLFVNPETYGDGDAGTSDTERTYDPRIRLGWRGPYASQPTGTYQIDIGSGFDSTYGSNGDPCLVDGWNHPIVIQNPPSSSANLVSVRLISAGPNGILDTPVASATILEDDVHVTFQLQ